MKKWPLLVLISLLILPVALAQSYDLNLSIDCPDTFNLSTTTNYKFIIVNLNGTASEYINFTLEYWISNNTGFLSGYPKFKTEDLKTSQTISHQWTPTASGNFSICGNITNSTANDTNLQNNYVCKEVYVQLVQENVKLSVNLDSPLLTDLKYTSLFKIKIEYKEQCADNKDDDVTIYYNITNSSNALIKEDTFTATEIGCSKSAGTGSWIPQQPGSYTLCGQITSSTVNESDFSDNTACENITVVQNPLTVLSVPLSSKWGSSNLMLINFNTTYYGYNKTRFLIYGANKRVATDLSWTKIISYSQCQGSTAVEIENDQNQTYYLLLPFFLYPNCDNYYSSDSYKLALRICNPKSDPTQFEKWADYLFDVTISGKNSALCPSSNSESSSQAAITSTTSSSTLDVEILEAPDNATQGQTITLKINITNDYDSTKNIEVYSYAYTGQNLITEGGWVSNKQEFVLAADETKTLSLTNTIKQDAQLGTHTLKVRAKVDETKKDNTQRIEIFEGKLQTQEEQEDKIEIPEDKTTENYQPKNGELITGAVIWASKTNRNISFAMLIFIAALLVLVTALIISILRR